MSKVSKENLSPSRRSLRRITAVGATMLATLIPGAAAEAKTNHHRATPGGAAPGALYHPGGASYSPNSAEAKKPKHNHEYFVKQEAAKLQEAARAGKKVPLDFTKTVAWDRKEPADSPVNGVLISWPERVVTTGGFISKEVQGKEQLFVPFAGPEGITVEAVPMQTSAIREIDSPTLPSSVLKQYPNAYSVEGQNLALGVVTVGGAGGLREVVAKDFMQPQGTVVAYAPIAHTKIAGR